MHPQILTRPEAWRDFLERAIHLGIDEVCFTDHMPLSLSRAKDRMPAGSVREYCRRVRKIGAEYADRITVLCGIEIDYHPSVLSEIEAVLGEGEFDRILGSSHIHLFCKDTERYTKNDFARAALENSLAAVESGLFTNLSHPDMFRFPFTRPDRYSFLEGDDYTPEKNESLIRTLLKRAAEKGVVLEINPHLAEAMENNLSYLYPSQRIMEWALEIPSLTFTYGSDAHKAEAVGALLDKIEAHPLYGGALNERRV
ncbi:MAG: PHP domain-containing protein [Clostridia bacterium]|nr:PHP domain-containing protein [Clostridia bacterium]